MLDFDPTKKSDDAEAMSDYLRDVGNVLEGITAMRENFQLYVPKFPKERKERYALRRELSKMTNVFRDVVEGLASKPFAREVRAEDAPEYLEPIIEDIDGRSNHMSVFAGHLFFQGIADSISWIRVDYPNAGPFQNKEEEAAAGVRPYWLQVNHGDVIEIKSERQASGERLTYMRFWEDDATIMEMWPDRWNRLRKNESGEWAIAEEGLLTIGVIPMVPFITGRRKGSTWQFFPPMRDALDAQIELFVQQCALKFAETMTCFPILSANGVKPATDATGKPLPLEIGPDAVLYAPPDSNGVSGSWERVEPSTASLKHLAEGIKEQIKEIRELGRQPLTAQSGNLTRISAATAASKGNSAVQQWAGSLKDALENAMKITALWLNQSIEAEIDVYTDFTAGDDDGTTAKTLIDLYNASAISLETLWDELRRIGLLSDNFDQMEEATKILRNGVEE